MKSPILVTVAGLLASLVACNRVEFDDEKLIIEAKAAIAQELAEPTGVKFKHVHAPSAGEQRINGVVCGEVLGTFKSGKQGEYRVFVYAKLAGFSGIEEMPEAGEVILPEAKAYQVQFDALWVDFCMTE
jgi:hypothetical protein